MSSSSLVYIKVKTRFEPSISNIKKQEYFFSYHIAIRNQNNFSIQIMYRHWDIVDFMIGPRKIKGDGIVGEKPIIANGETYAYTSFCFLRRPMGMMKGYYDAVNIDTQETFRLDIPHFFLCMPHILN